MKVRNAVVISLVFVLGAVAGFAAKKGVDASMYQSKSKQEAAKALLDIARVQAGKGSWEQLGVARVYYLGGMKAEGQKIIDTITAGKKVEGSDWLRVGRIYYEAKEWDKAKAAFDKAILLDPKQDKWLAEIGSYYLLKGDRAKAEELFGKSFGIESGEVWNTANIAGAYLGIEPLQ
jgi:tetratricopeptide (TPR) repeat protein